MKSIKSLLLITTLSAIGVASSSSESDAATATATIAVSATVASGCTISALPLAFGAYDQTSATPNDASTSVTVLCTVGTPYNVGLNAGGGTGATVATRKMTSGANTLNYTLYTNSGRSTVWGNTVGTDTVSGTYSIGQAALTVYGRIPALQATPSGSYSDTVTVTITY